MVIRLIKIMMAAIIISLFAFIETNFLALEINGIMPNLVWILVFGISFFEIKFSLKPKWRGFLAAFLGGLLLSFFSSLPVGTQALLLIVIVLALQKALQFLGEINFVVYVVSFLIFFIIYQVGLNLLVFKKFIFPTWIKLIYALILSSLFYLICFLTVIRKEK